jgi:vacuolar-type H+-ATPase subunit F/Vma7
MTVINQLGIAVIGDEDLVNGLRLAGVNKYVVVSEASNKEDQVKKALNDLVDSPEIGIIVIQENFIEYVSELVTKLRQSRRLTPVIIEVPSKYGTEFGDVREFYKKYAREFIGFDIEI